MTVDTAAARAVPDAARVCGLRLYTRAAVTPRWLARSVLPAVRALRGDPRASVVYLRRGWLHGPHVDLVARMDRGRPPGWDAIAAGLDAGPVDQAAALTDETYLAQARELGRLERVPPPYLPMRPHGAVEFLDTAEVSRWPQPLDGLRETSLSQMCTPLARTVDSLVADPAAATALVAEAFVALAAAHQSGLGFGVLSMRSHAEAFLAWVAPRRDARPAFDRRLRDDAEVLRPVVEAALDGRWTPGAAAWRTAFAYCMGALDCAVANGLLTLDGLESLSGTVDPATMGPPGRASQLDGQQSEFHRTVGESGIVDDPSEWFASYRLLVNLFYQQLPLLGVSPMHRYYLCHAVAETVDAVLGETWRDRIERAVR